MARITLAEHENKYENKCKYSYTLYIVLFSIIFTINIGAGTFFVDYKYMNHDKKTIIILFFKQQFAEHIKMTVKSINIKNWIYYLFNDMININLLKIDKKSYKNIDIY